jgi:hypothetical protein
MDRAKLEACVNALMVGTGSTGTVPVLNYAAMAVLADKSDAEAASDAQGQDSEAQ